MKKNIFSLDIGTRSVTGIILEETEDKYRVVDFCMIEHKERSMLDGQIHNVVAVADVINEVKETLEQRNGALEEVCVAAAGRALKTIQSEVSVQLKEQPITDREAAKHLELSAVQVAQTELATSDGTSDHSNYYCVGYSVLYYKLDNEIIGSLVDQNGEEATVQIIATFLPKVVVESLLAALSRANLKMEALTLEPIAAIHVLIPESMRRLNVALVDIGAGTSDIALTNDNTITAYGMVPIAGDEITEAISDHYLLDFPEAEKTKRNIVINGQDNVYDILGFETTITHERLLDIIDVNLEKLAAALAEEIMSLNKKPPKAVMLIGGGSLTPNITSILAKKLQLPNNRVAVRGIEAIQSLVKDDQLPTGPDFVTPIGIAIASKQNPLHYISIKVNNIIVRMFEMKELTIGDCLVQAGIEINKFYGRPGLASIITLNGKKVTLPGGYGQPPTILLKNKVEQVGTKVLHGDEIYIQKGNDGTQPSTTLNELVGVTPPISITFNGRDHLLQTTIYVNKTIRNSDYFIQDKDKIHVEQQKTIKDFFDSINLKTIDNLGEFFIYVNNQIVNLHIAQTEALVNNQQITMNHKLMDGDTISISHGEPPTISDLVSQLRKEYWWFIKVSFNGEPVEMKKQQITFLKDNIVLDKNTSLTVNDRIIMNEDKIKPFIFQDVFRYVDLDLTNVKGTFKLYKNNEPTTFYDTVQTGDKLEIRWE